MNSNKYYNQLYTMHALYVGISQTKELAAKTLWNERQFGCSVGALIPVGERTDETRARLLTDSTWWEQWDKDILYMTANANNAFVGTDRERQQYMLKWTADMFRKIQRGMNIVEGSDLTVPHFEVPTTSEYIGNFNKMVCCRKTKSTTPHSVEAPRELVSV